MIGKKVLALKKVMHDLSSGSNNHSQLNQNINLALASQAYGL